MKARLMILLLTVIALSACNTHPKTINAADSSMAKHMAPGEIYFLPSQSSTVLQFDSIISAVHYTWLESTQGWDFQRADIKYYFPSQHIIVLDKAASRLAWFDKENGRLQKVTMLTSVPAAALQKDNLFSFNPETGILLYQHKGTLMQLDLNKDKTIPITVPVLKQVSAIQKTDNGLFLLGRDAAGLYQVLLFNSNTADYRAIALGSAGEGDPMLFSRGDLVYLKPAISDTIYAFNTAQQVTVAKYNIHYDREDFRKSAASVAAYSSDSREQAKINAAAQNIDRYQGLVVNDDKIYFSFFFLDYYHGLIYSIKENRVTSLFPTINYGKDQFFNFFMSAGNDGCFISMLNANDFVKFSSDEFKQKIGKDHNSNTVIARYKLR